MRFRVREGDHLETEPDEETGRSRVYHKGEIVESDIDLSKKFVNKFDKLSDKEPRAAKVAREAREEDEEGTEEDDDVVSGETKSVMDPANKDTLSGLSSKLGENVTEDFELAQEAELAVFKKGKKFYIVEPEDTNVALNDDPLSSTAEVNKALKKYLKKG